MRWPRLPILAIFAAISALVLAILLLGHFSMTRLASSRVSGTNPSVRYQEWMIELNRGQCVVVTVWNEGRFDPERYPAGWKTHRTFLLSWPEPHRLWGLEGRTVSLENYRTRFAAFPLWCLALPAAIAPSLWLHRWNRRRKIRPQRGFEVAAAPYVGQRSSVAP